MACRPATALAGATAVLLGVLLLLELRPEAAAPMHLSAPVRPVAGAGPRLALPGVEGLLARPLFTPGRRPPAVTVAAPVPPAARVQAPRLVGVVASGAGRHAVFALGDGRTAVAGPGQRVDGFLVREIGPETVTLDGEDGEQVLRLAFARPGGASAAPAAPPSALLAPEPSGPEAPDPAAARGVPAGPASSALPGRPS